MNHAELAFKWCKYKGQKGTQKQVEKIMRTLSVEALIKLLSERNAL